MKDYEKIILTRPKLVVNTKCKKCSSRDIAAVPVVDYICKNCNTKQETEVNIDMYYSVAKAIERKLKKDNGVYIVGERENSKVFHPDNALKPRSRYENDVWHAMLEILDTKKGQRCWEMSKITNEYSYEYHIKCNDCGYCKECVECTACGHHYKPKEVKSGKRYTCPECNHKNYRQTKINKFKKNNKGNPICPECESTKVANARFSSDKKSCPKCGSSNLSKPRNIPVYMLLIERQKRFWIQKDE